MTKDTREAKREKFAQPGGKQRLPVSVLVVVGVALLIGAVILWQRSSSVSEPQLALAGGGRINPEATELTEADVRNGAVSLPLSTFDDGHAHYYAYTTENGFVEFFVLKSSDGVVRAALNACDACYPSQQGYRQEGDEMVCNNCGQRFPSDRINEVKGGCNPAPLNRKVIGDNLVILVDDIIAGGSYFR
jgi:uncharacterized membrane protein